MEESIRDKIKNEPLNLSELILYCCRYFHEEILLVLAITAVFALPANLLWAFMDFSDPKNIMFNTALLLIYLLILMVTAFIAPLFITWAVSMMKQKLESDEASEDPAWKTAWDRYLPLAWVFLLQGLIIIGMFLPGIIVIYCLAFYALLQLFAGVPPAQLMTTLSTMSLSMLLTGRGLFFLGLCCLCLVPGTLWTVYYTFGIFVVSVLPLKGKAALNYSKALVRGHWWGVCLLGLLIWLLTAALPFLIDPENPVLHALTTTLFELIAPFSIFPLGLWFLNLHFLHQRSLLPPVPLSIPQEESSGGFAPGQQ